VSAIRLANCRSVEFLHSFLKFRVNQFQIVLAEKFVLGVARNPLSSRIHVCELSTGVGRVDYVGRFFDQVSILLLAMTQVFLFRPGQEDLLRRRYEVGPLLAGVEVGGVDSMS